MPQPARAGRRVPAASPGHGVPRRLFRRPAPWSIRGVRSLRAIAVPLAALALAACAGPAARTRDEQPAAPSFPPAAAAVLEHPPGEGNLEVLAADSLARFVRSHAAELRACYDEALARAPVLRGKVVIRFTIRTDGSVSDVSPWYDNLGGGVARPCLVDKVAAWRTPFRPAEPVLVQYPFAFAPPPRDQPGQVPAVEALPSGRLEAAATRRPLE